MMSENLKAKIKIQPHVGRSVFSVKELLLSLEKMYSYMDVSPDNLDDISRQLATVNEQVSYIIDESRKISPPAKPL